jgi:Lycopene cyclase
MYHYAYLTGAMIIFPVWLALFLIKKSNRGSMVLVGLYVVLLAIPLEFIWFLKDYWNPLKYVSVATFLYQEAMFAFFIGGIVSAVYVIPERRGRNFKLTNLIMPIVILMLAMLIFTNGLRLNSIYSCDIGFGITVLMILCLKKDLIKKSIISSLSGIVITIVGYKILLMIYPNLIKDWWRLNNTSGILLWGIPLEDRAQPRF